jgi:hypothetical protein
MTQQYERIYVRFSGRAPSPPCCFRCRPLLEVVDVDSVELNDRENLSAAFGIKFLYISNTTRAITTSGFVGYHVVSGVGQRRKWLRFKTYN